jgi:uncharacterized repeat protein (TIGR01451 family)
VQITFVATQPGQLCNTVEVEQEGGGILGSGKACVTVVAAAAPPAGAAGAAAAPADRPKLVAKKTGPARMNVGETAKFTIEITNQGKVPATQLKVIDHYDPSLSPTEASFAPTPKSTGGDLEWEVDSLAPGKSIKIFVNCECIEPAPNSCNRVAVTCQEQVRAAADACLVIAAPPGGISVTMAEKADPLKVGDRTTYEIKVANHGQAADGQVVVVVTVPKEMIPLRIDTKGPSGATASLDGQVMRFAPVAELRPGDVLTYSVQVRGQSAGQATCRVEVTTAKLKTPITQEETTRVVPAQ